MKTILRTALVLAVTASLFPAAVAAKREVKPVPRPARQGEVVAVTEASVAILTRQDVRSVWTQYGPSGVLEARAMVEADACPEMVLDLHKEEMVRRAKADASFLTVCSAVIPAGTKQAALAFLKFRTPLPSSAKDDAARRSWTIQEYGSPPPAPDASMEEKLIWALKAEQSARYDLIPLPVPIADPQRIVVFGDTGCRVLKTVTQDCSDPDAWPFARIAAEAAKLKPDLVIHVGDYLYREAPCPAGVKGCEGSPYGDNWPAWDADFFAPAAPLLATAPWVMVRGNHESCSRAGPGFIRLLGPEAFDPAAPCNDHLPAFAVPFAGLNLVVTDDAIAPETAVLEKEVPAFRAEIASLANQPGPTWWLLHRPIWGAISGPLGIPAGGNLTLMAAVGETGIPAPVELMLSGHIHSFEAINYFPNDHVPPQIVAGFGGDKLDETPASLFGTIFQGSSGVHVKDGISVGGFGFALLTRRPDGWRIELFDSHGNPTRQCRFANDRLDCPQPPRR